MGMSTTIINYLSKLFEQIHSRHFVIIHFGIDAGKFDRKFCGRIRPNIEPKKPQKRSHCDFRVSECIQNKNRPTNLLPLLIQVQVVAFAKLLFGKTSCFVVLSVLSTLLPRIEFVRFVIERAHDCVCVVWSLVFPVCSISITKR